MAKFDYYCRLINASSSHTGGIERHKEPTHTGVI